MTFKNSILGAVAFSALSLFVHADDQRPIVRYFIEEEITSNDVLRRAIFQFLEKMFSQYQLRWFDSYAQSMADIIVTLKKQIPGDEVNAIVTINLKNVDEQQKPIEAIVMQGFNKSIKVTLAPEDEELIAQWKSNFDAQPLLAYCVQFASDNEYQQKGLAVLKALTVFLTEKFPQHRLIQHASLNPTVPLLFSIQKLDPEGVAFVTITIQKADGMTVKLQEASFVQGKVKAKIQLDPRDEKLFDEWRAEFIAASTKTEVTQPLSPILPVIKMRFNAYSFTTNEPVLFEPRMKQAVHEFLTQLMAPAKVIVTTNPNDQTTVMIDKKEGTLNSNSFSVSVSSINGKLVGPFVGVYQPRLNKVRMSPDQQNQLQAWRNSYVAVSVSSGKQGTAVTPPTNNADVINLISSKKLLVSISEIKSKRPLLDVYKNILQAMFSTFTIEFVEDDQSNISAHVKILEDAQGNTVFVFAPRSTEIGQLKVMLRGSTVQSKAAQPVFEISQINKNLIRTWADEFFK